MTLLEQAKQRLSLEALLMLLGLGDIAKKSARCPFHEDKTPSFSLYQNAKSDSRWKCHAGCGQGDAIDFLAKFENIPIAAACARFIELAGLSGATARRVLMAAPREVKLPKHEVFPDEIYRFSAEECRVADRMTATLSADLALCKRVADVRNWKLETVRRLADHSCLGWKDDELAFIYGTGVKLRGWRQRNDRRFRFAFGKPWIWRAAWLYEARTTYICESETDAISLIDGGIEDDGSTVVVATSGVNGFNPEWVHLFAGKHVILAFDNDDAGRQATSRVSNLLLRHAGSLRQLNWGGAFRGA